VFELNNLGTDSNGSTNSAAAAINDSGMAAGWASKYVAGFNVSSPAVRWDSTGAATELQDLSGFVGSMASALNDAGIVVGTANATPGTAAIGTRPVRWDLAGVATPLGILGTDSNNFTIGSAYAINNVQTSVGFVTKYESGVSKGYRAIRWDSSGAATELGGLGTDNSGSTTNKNTYAVSINTEGTSVGYVPKYVGGIYKGSRAVRWGAAGTAATELGGLGTDNNGITDTQAFAINDAGITVGYAEAFDGLGNDLGRRAVMWGADALATDLNMLIDPASGWFLISATSISNDNWITGLGRFDPDGGGPLAGYDRLFLVQVPEPGTVALLGIATMGLLLRRR
jgi:hypothetical protein